MGRRIEIYGTTRHDMNGKRGVATDSHLVDDVRGCVDMSRSRYTVLLDSGETFKARLANVRAEGLAATAPLLDTRVETHGIVDHPELNGLRGVAHNYLRMENGEWGYVVTVDACRGVGVCEGRFRPANLRTERAGARTAARPKAKGKGKGRG